MKLGHYTLNKEGVISIGKHMKSSLMLKIFGIPLVNGKSIKQIAKEIILANKEEWGVLAGKSHFRYMWAVDFGKSFNGLKKILSKSYLKKQLQRIINESFKKGYVPTCFGKKHSFDMPFPRIDNLPWLIYSIDSYVQHFKDKQFIKSNKMKLENLYKKFMLNYFDYTTNMIKDVSKFDWMDSVLRPSSTYSNLCLIQMFNSVKNLNLKVKTFSSKTKKSLMSRWKGNYFEDYENSGDYLSADANVPVLYFNLFSKKIRKKIIDKIESSKLLEPVPMKLREGNYVKNRLFLTRFAGGYHSVIWPHIGLMYLNGLKNNKVKFKKHLEKLEKIYVKHKNILESLDMSSNPFKSFFVVTEFHFTMAAGQYLELVD